MLDARRVCAALSEINVPAYSTQLRYPHDYGIQHPAKGVSDESNPVIVLDTISVPRYYTDQ